MGKTVEMVALILADKERQSNGRDPHGEHQHQVASDGGALGSNKSGRRDKKRKTGPAGTPAARNCSMKATPDSGKAQKNNNKSTATSSAKKMKVSRSGTAGAAGGGVCDSGEGRPGGGSSDALIASGATLIVVPEPLLGQWMEEVACM
jgi:hypothetical protein